MKILIFSILTCLMTYIDFISKWYVIQSFSAYTPYHVLSWLNIHLTYNTGAAFSLFSQSGPWKYAIFILSMLIIIAIVVREIIRQPSTVNLWIGTLIISGAVGNALDRVLYGKVTDFISLHVGDWYFAIFNMADVFITVGCVVWFINNHLIDQSKNQNNPV